MTWAAIKCPDCGEWVSFGRLHPCPRHLQEAGKLRNRVVEAIRKHRTSAVHPATDEQLADDIMRELRV